MQQLEQRSTPGHDRSYHGDRKQVQAVMERLTSQRSHGETLAEVAHDAGNMVAALGLYCDLLEEPGVLTASFVHYGDELRLLAAASRRLVEQLWSLQTAENPGAAARGGSGREPGLPHLPGADSRQKPKSAGWASLPSTPIANLEEELLANRSLLGALAGPSITIAVNTMGGNQPVRLTGEDLTRILVNLVKNSAEAMPKGGTILIDLREGAIEPGAAPRLMLTIEDNGPGIPTRLLKNLFEPGITTRVNVAADKSGGWTGLHRGLGLSITRAIVEAAGGQVRAANRDPDGACFQIELPVATR